MTVQNYSTTTIERYFLRRCKSSNINTFISKLLQTITSGSQLYM